MVEKENQGFPSQPASPDGRVLVEVIPDLVVEAPEIGKVRGKPLGVDLAEVERLASLGMQPKAIGPAMKIPVERFYRQFHKSAKIREAYERGNAVWQEALLTQVKAQIAKGNNPALLIFSLKQMHGAGWADNVKMATETQAVSDAQRKFLDRKKQEAKTKVIELEKGEDGEYAKT